VNLPFRFSYTSLHNRICHWWSVGL